MYGHAAPTRSVEVLALRLEVTGSAIEETLGRGGVRIRRPPAGTRHVLVWNGRPLTVTRYVRDELVHGTRFTGPALVVEYSSTTLVPPGWRADVDADCHLHLVEVRR
jgi:N-methylhydantoinase A